MPPNYGELALRYYSIQRFNPQSFTLRFALPVCSQLTDLLTAVDDCLKTADLRLAKKIGDTVIGLDSLYLQAKRSNYFDNADMHCVTSLLTSLLTTFKSSSGQGVSAEPMRIKACYHPALAPDLEQVAREKNLSIGDIITLHTATIYTVYAIGFLPGFAYMGYLPDALHIERKATPRTQVPQGSVGLAHNQTGIYPRTSPGGWQIIARTALNCFDAKASLDKACPFSVGQQIKFEAISLAEYQGLAGE